MLWKAVPDMISHWNLCEEIAWALVIHVNYIKCNNSHFRNCHIHKYMFFVYHELSINKDKTLLYYCYPLFLSACYIHVRHRYLLLRQQKRPSDKFVCILIIHLKQIYMGPWGRQRTLSWSLNSSHFKKNVYIVEHICIISWK